MPLLKKHPVVVRLTAACLMIASLFACSTWQPVPLSPERFQVAYSNQVLRVTLQSADTLLVRYPVIRHDSLQGVQTFPQQADGQARWVSLPLTAIAQAELEKTDTGRSVAVAAGVLVALLVWAAVDFQNAWDKAWRTR